MTTDTSEAGLETLITEYLVNHNQYISGNPQDYDKAFCLDRLQLLAFLEATQADTLAKIPHHDKLLQRLSDQIRDKGIVEVLRKGIKYQQHRLTLYYPQPPNNLNPEAVQTLSGQPLFRYPAGPFQPAAPWPIAGYGHLHQRPAPHHL